MIVIDIGTSLMKAGWAGEDAPRVVFPTVLLDGQGNTKAVVDGSNDGETLDYLVGYAALKAVQLAAAGGAGKLITKQLNRPIDRGTVKVSSLSILPSDRPSFSSFSPLSRFSTLIQHLF